MPDFCDSEPLVVGLALPCGTLLPRLHSCYSGQFRLHALESSLYIYSISSSSPASSSLQSLPLTCNGRTLNASLCPPSHLSRRTSLFCKPPLPSSGFSCSLCVSVHVVTVSVAPKRVPWDMLHIILYASLNTHQCILPARGDMDD